MHGESALFIARTFYKTTAVVKYAGGATGLPGTLLMPSTVSSLGYERCRWPAVCCPVSQSPVCISSAGMPEKQ